MALLFRQITVCGIGLIGGSLALLARRHGLVERIVGLGRGQANLDVALGRGLIDEGTLDPKRAAAGAELVLLASPILAMPKLLAAMVPYLPADAVITDVGSVKGWVVRELEPLLGPQMALVAAHPIAGKEITGAGAADPELFVGRRVILTPSARSTIEAVGKVEQLWAATRARVERMTPEQHDRILAQSSHLPQMVSSALGMALADSRVGSRYVAEYGAGGLRDTTRLAASSPEMWRDIALTNREQLVCALQLFDDALHRLRGLIEQAEGPAIEAAIAEGGRVRRRLAPWGPRERPIVAIDGPVGAGKSTIARELARELGFTYLNTGAMYRAVAIAAARRGLDDQPGAESALAELLADLEPRFEGERLLLNGEDVSDCLAEPAVGDLASRLSTLPSVRERMVQLQRAAASGGGVVIEGRDIGTVVFPDAEFKFFLNADVEVRAARRFAELRQRGATSSYEQVLAELNERDRRDRSRALAPLRCADDAIVIDSSQLTAAQVVARLKDHIQIRSSEINGA